MLYIARDNLCPVYNPIRNGYLDDPLTHDDDHHASTLRTWMSESSQPGASDHAGWGDPMRRARHSPERDPFTCPGDASPDVVPAVGGVCHTLARHRVAEHGRAGEEK